jgi:hypothetical protein
MQLWCVEYAALLIQWRSRRSFIIEKALGISKPYALKLSLQSTSHLLCPLILSTPHSQYSYHSSYMQWMVCEVCNTALSVVLSSAIHRLDFKDRQRRSHEERQPCAHVVAALQLLGTYYGLEIQHGVLDRSIVTTACCNLAWASI